MANEFALPDDVVLEILSSAERVNETSESATELLAALHLFSKQAERSVTALREATAAARQAIADCESLATVRERYAAVLTASNTSSLKCAEMIRDCRVEDLPKTAAFVDGVTSLAEIADADIRHALSGGRGDA